MSPGRPPCTTPGPARRRPGLALLLAALLLACAPADERGADRPTGAPAVARASQTAPGPPGDGVPNATGVALGRPDPAGRPAVVPLAEPVASYRIQATLAADGRSLQGAETVRYRNPSPDTLGELYLHLYLNAFRSPETVWMRESGRSRRRFAASPETAGWTRVESVRVDGAPAAVEPEGDGTIARLALPHPLPPGQEGTLEIAWTAQLPRVFARTGWAPDGFTMVAQWYPKLAVYDPRRGGWDREPWHANAEFFHDFGDYELELVVPAARATVLATGEPVGLPEERGDTRVWRFRALSVSDVAWMAAERFATRERTTAAGVTLVVALPSAWAASADRYLETAAHALDRFSAWLGPYPWSRLVVVVPSPEGGAAGGMEYPMLVTSVLETLELPDALRFIEVVTVHEVAHQWFPLQVASDEGREPWLDEGFADYLTTRLLAERYGPKRSLLDLPLLQVGYGDLHRLLFASVARTPITRPAWEYGDDYSAAVYSKGALFLATLEGVFGREPFTDALRSYVAAWRWRHPTTADLQAVLEDQLGAAVDPWLDQLAHGRRVLDGRAAVVEPDRALVVRDGDATLPLAGVLRLASGAQQPWTLDADQAQLELGPPPGDRIAAVELDPNGALAIELDRLDNGLTAAPQTDLLAGAVARWLQALALWLQVVGMFG